MLAEKNVLVTGAAGFIGSNLVDALISAGACVKGLDNMTTGKAGNLVQASKTTKFELIKGDIRNMELLRDIMTGIDVVYHEAAITSVQQSIESPHLCNEVNVTGTLNVLEAARARDVNKVVFASSAAIYGNNATLPKREDMHVQPISPYGVSKLSGESYCYAYHAVYGLNTVALRYFNVFGNRQDCSPYSGVIAIFLANIMQGKNPVIHGDGSQTRDFIYIKDVVNANLLAASTIKASGSIINIATGIATSVNDMTIAMLQACNKNELHVVHDDPRSGDIIKSYADISLAKKMLNFSPKYDILTGLKDLVSIYQNSTKMKE